MGNAQVPSHLSEKTALGKLQHLGRSSFHLVLLVLLGFVVYSNTFGAPFQFDSRLNILENGIIRDISNIPKIFYGNEGPFASRPLMHATFALNYYFGRFDTWGYHVVNLAIHITNVILLYFLIMTTGRHLGQDNTDVRTAAFLASVAFAVHPLQTGAVTYIVGRSMLFSTMFYLAGMILFLKTVETDKRKALHIVCLTVVVFLGMASRENFATFPFILVLFDLFFISRFRIRELARHWKIHLPAFLGLGYMAFIVLNNTYDKGPYFTGLGVPHKDYFLTQFNVHWTYLRLLLLPINQNIDYDYPISRTLFEFPTLFSFIGYVGLWAVGIGLARRKPVLSFSVIWFLVALLPISFLVTFTNLRLDDVIFEHRLYLPGAAFFALAGAASVLALKSLDSKRLRTAAVAVGVIVPLVLAIAAFNRNTAWQSQISLWEDALAKSPRKARVYNNLGQPYYTEGQIQKAMEYFKTATELDPLFPKAHFNLGTAYESNGLYDQAMEQYYIAISLYSEFAEAYNNLGVVLGHLGQLDKAKEHFLTAIKLKPDFAVAYNNLGLYYQKTGQAEKAMEHFQHAIRLDPYYAEAYVNLGTALGNLGRLDEAIEQFQTAIRLDPEYAAAHKNLGVAYKMMGLKDKAKEHFRQARELEQRE